MRVGASIGLAFGPQEECDAFQMLKQADVAMYAAKADGKGRGVRFQSPMLAKFVPLDIQGVV